MKMNDECYIKLYCDGACSGNPGPGGWGAILLFKENKKELYGFEENTTNNRMELTAAIMGLRAIKKPIPILLYTDSMYLKQGITEWIQKWKKNNWNKGAVKNRDLWEQLDVLNSQYSITWIWIKGHSGELYNELADTLAREAMLKKIIKC